MGRPSLRAKLSGVEPRHAARRASRSFYRFGTQNEHKTRQGKQHDHLELHHRRVHESDTRAHSYCATHRDQIRKGFTPGEAPARYVDADTVRPLLLELKGKHSMADLGRMLGCTPRTVARAAQSDTVKISRTLAEGIRLVSGEHFEPVEPIHRDKTGISGPETAEYANTPEGLAFIAECRHPKARKAMAA